MPSRLRYQTSIEEQESYQTIRRTASPPQKKQKMSLSQTYFIAASARSKLGKEANRADHNLRLLVGHANLLDSLMLDLHEAEREQEAWFHQTVQKAAREEPKHIQWMDTLEEGMDEDEDEELDDAASEASEESDEEEEYTIATPRSIRAAPVSITTREMHADEEYDDEDDEEHALVRTVSGTSAQSPPELVDDSDSEDESPPNSPPHVAIEFSEQQRQAIATTAFFDKKVAALTSTEEMDFIENGYFLPERNQQAPLVAAY